MTFGGRLVRNARLGHLTVRVARFAAFKCEFLEEVSYEMLVCRLDV